MVVRSSALACASAVVIALLGGCGSGGSSSSGTPTSTTAGSSEVPKELLGKYEVTLTPADLPDNPAPELVHGSSTWHVTIANSGGTGGGSSFAIANASLGSLEDTNFTVEGDSVVLHQEECASKSGYDFYDNEYRYTASSKSLTLATVSNQCPDAVAETILTSKPLERVG
jgi:hypothetical protein